MYRTHVHVHVLHVLASRLLHVHVRVGGCYMYMCVLQCTTVHVQVQYSYMHVPVHVHVLDAISCERRCMDRYMVGDPTGNRHTNLPLPVQQYSTYSHTAVSRHTGTVSTGPVPVQDRYRTLIPVSYTGIL